MFSELNKYYDDARRAELARQARLSRQQSECSPERTSWALQLWRFLHTNRPTISLDPVSDEPMTRERLAAVD